MKVWHNARETRSIQNGFIFHSDRGVQYAANKMTKMFLFSNKITQSMSRKEEEALLLKDWDNAVAESFFKTIKHEWFYRFRFKSFEQLYLSIEEYIQWYNTKRLHSTLGYLSPLEMELELRNNIKKAA